MHSLGTAGSRATSSSARSTRSTSRPSALVSLLTLAHLGPLDPTSTVWLACVLSFILGLPSLGSAVAFSAATSIATIGLYISYGVPIALRVAYAPRFVRGPFHLGAFSFPVAIAAVLWICFITIAFVLPEENPVDSQTLNYAVVAVGIVVTYSLGFWVISARKWFTGPVKQIAGECAGRSGSGDMC